MKICIVGLDDLPALVPGFSAHGIGGEPVQRSLLAKALAQRGYETTMVVGDYGQEDGAEYHNVPTYKAYRFDAGVPIVRFIYPRWTGMWAALRRADADVYYTSCAGMTLGLLAMFCQRHNRGLVFRLASDSDADPRQLLVRYWRDKKLYEYGLRRSHVVLAQTFNQQRALKQNYGISQSKVADMLVDPPTDELELSDRDIDMLWVSNLRNLKRPDLALELAKQLPQHRIHMVGGLVAGFRDCFEKTRKLASAMENVIFHGPVAYHDIGHIFDRTRIFINTSDVEGFPNTYLQSWRRGVPVVAFFDPDGIIQREGLGTAVTTMEEMARAVESLLLEDFLWQETSRRCSRYMEQSHSDEIVLQNYIDAFDFANRQRNNRTA
jgi:glycosyltransferase involved in cell wall biosynthesis